jgi:long-chain acyl-CoA synthetase
MSAPMFCLTWVFMRTEIGKVYGGPTRVSAREKGFTVFAPLSDLRRHASERGADIALASPWRNWSFAELEITVEAVAIRLRQEGIRPRHVVGVDLPSALEWIVDLALMRLAARSVSLRGVSRRGGLALDALLATPGARADVAPMMLHVDDAWIVSTVCETPGVAPGFEYARTDSIFRFILTSGTTGQPRAAAYSVGALAHRRAARWMGWTDGRAELNLMPLSTTGGLHTALADLDHGQTHLAVDFIDEATLRFAAAHGVQVLCGSPAQIASALGVLANVDLNLPHLEEVRLAGATPSATLLRLITERLRVPIRSVYGSTEGGAVAARMVQEDDDLVDVGKVLPGREVQIIDETGAPVPAGTEGTVRYRGRGMTSGYFEDGAVTEFPRGWIEPGDVGVLTPDGSLVLAGRTSEIINIGGQKINPTVVDELALEFLGVRDAAAFGLEQANGMATLGLAVVSTPDCDLRELDRYLRSRLGNGHPSTFWRVREIPRNRMGKAKRQELATAFARTSDGR